MYSGGGLPFLGGMGLDSMISIAALYHCANLKSSALDGDAGYFGKRKNARKMAGKINSFKKQRQQPTAIEVLPIGNSKIMILPPMEIA